MNTHPSHRPTRRRIREIALSDQGGFTIIEVLVAAVILALVAAGSAVALIGAVGTSGIQRSRSAAEALAQQDEAKLRGYTVSQLANLNTTLSPVTLDGTQYTVQELATFVSDSSGTPSCTNPSADYIETQSTVSWAGMPAGQNPVVVNGVITPSYGEISSSAGILAVQVQDPSGNPYAGMPVSISGPSSASGVTASNGCVLFGDLPVGNYTVNVTPASGNYVDAGTDSAVNSSTPDTQTNVQVSAGTTAASPASFVLAVPGAASFTFTDLWPSGVSPSGAFAPVATSPSVVLTSGSLTTVCSFQDASTGCPPTTNPDVNWGLSAWGATNGQFTATPLVPATYASYPGVCKGGDDAASYGGADQTTIVTSGNTTSTNLKLPSIVVRLYSGTGVAGVVPVPIVGGSEMAMPAGSKLVITDTQCNGGEPYVGGPGSVTIPANDSALPVQSSPVINGGTNDIGLLAYPGMPYGKYTVCYQPSAASKSQLVSITNQANGEIVYLYNGAASLSNVACAT